MNNKIKRSLAATLTALTLCAPLSMTTAFPNINVNTITASAAEGCTSQISGKYTGNVYYDYYEGVQLFFSKDSNGVVITGCQTRKCNTTIRIPKQIDGADVVAIADNAFRDQTNIFLVRCYGQNTVNGTTYHPGGSSYGPLIIKGGSSISKIGNRAFYGCTNLANILIGDKELNVGDYAFYECDKFTHIQFYNSSNYTIDPKYGNIGTRAFSRSGMTSFGDWSDVATCKTLGNGAFSGCKDLAYVNFKASSIGSDCFGNCTKLREAKIDSPSIGDNAFLYCTALETLTLTNTKSIGASAFRDCTSLKSTNMPESIESVGNYAFFSDSKLASKMIFENRKGAGPLTIGVSAFEYSGIPCVQLYAGDITVADYAFANCNNLRCRVRYGNVKTSPLSGF